MRFLAPVPISFTGVHTNSYATARWMPGTISTSAPFRPFNVINSGWPQAGRSGRTGLSSSATMKAFANPKASQSLISCQHKLRAGATFVQIQELPRVALRTLYPWIRPLKSTFLCILYPMEGSPQEEVETLASSPLQEIRSSTKTFLPRESTISCLTETPRSEATCSIEPHLRRLTLLTTCCCTV